MQPGSGVISTTNLQLTVFRTANPAPVGHQAGRAQRRAGPNRNVHIVPAIPPLWLNEAQPENLTGPADTPGRASRGSRSTTPAPTRCRWTASTWPTTTPTSPNGPSRPGASIEPGEFKIVFADGEPGETTPTEWHASFRLAPGAGSVALRPDPGPASVGLPQLCRLRPDRSYGDYPDGQPFHRQEFFLAYPRRHQRQHRPARWRLSSMNGWRPTPARCSTPIMAIAMTTGLNSTTRATRRLARRLFSDGRSLQPNPVPHPGRVYHSPARIPAGLGG